VRTPALLAILALTACGGGGRGGDDGGPLVDLIPDAVTAVEDFYGGPQEYFEISAGLEEVGFVVAVDGGTAAEQGSYSADGVFTAPVPVGEASGTTFTAAQIDLDPDRIFDGLRSELDDPVIIDLAIQGGPNDTLLYDASVASEAGGVLLVLLGPTGQIRAVQAQ
jgi:hypothetical protein